MCRLDTDGSGVSAAHCSSCYVSSAHSAAGDRPRSSSAAPGMPADTAAELRRLQSMVDKQIDMASLMGCGSIVKPTTVTKPVKKRPPIIADMITS